MWPVWLLLVCLLLGTVLTPGHPYYCGHCRGRSCGSWCRWCR
jgi:hypothetical protein